MTRSTFRVAESYVRLLKAMGDRTMSTHDIIDEIGPTIRHTNISAVITRAQNHRWLRVVGREKNPRGGTDLRVMRVTVLGKILLRYAAVERAMRR